MAFRVLNEVRRMLLATVGGIYRDLEKLRYVYTEPKNCHYSMNYKSKIFSEVHTEFTI
jgi:hypothetical protein